MIPETASRELRALVGDDWFLDTPEDLATYSYDAFLPAFMPEAVILPTTTTKSPRS